MLGRFTPSSVRVERDPSLIGANVGVCGFATIRVSASLGFEYGLHPISFYALTLAIIGSPCWRFVD